MKYGETVNFGLDKQIERLVEVIAASALLQANSKDMDSLKKLREHAFPDKINFTDKQINYKQRVIRDYFGNCVKCGIEHSGVCKK